MGFLSRFEGKMEDTFEGAADKMFDAPISPVQIAKKAEKQMRREKMVGAGKQYAPTLYTVLVNPDDDRRLFGYYPTLAGETETYLAAKASEQGLVMDGQPLVRFIVDEDLKHGKFDIIAEAVAAPIIAQLRAEEMARYGLATPGARGNYGSQAGAVNAGRGTGMPAAQSYDPYAPIAGGASANPYGTANPYAANAYGAGANAYANPAAGAAPAGYDTYDEFDAPAAAGAKPPLPYVPEEELDYSIDYGEYTFDSRDFDEQRDGGYLQGDAAAAAGAAGAAGAGAAAGAAFGAAGAAGAVAGAGVAGAAAASQIPARQPNAAPMQAPNTVVFAGGNQAATPMPTQSAVHARLIDTTTNRTYDLASARLLMGRESKNDIVVQDINASRTHAELRFEPQGVWVITDLGSTNGTFVNDRQIASQPLTNGDRITIGMTVYVFTQA